MPATAPQGARARVWLLLLGVVWGLNWPAVKVALSGVSPWGLRTIGLGAAACTVFALGWLRHDRMRVARGRERRHIVVAGLLNVAAFNLLLTFAQLNAATARVAILTYSMPLWATLLAWLVLRERLDRLRLSGLLLGAAGLGWLLLPLMHAGLSRGVWLALAAAITWAAGTVYSKWARLTTPPMAVAAWQLLIGAAVALAGLLGVEGLPHWSALAALPYARPYALPYAVWLALGYHVVFGMACGYVLWFNIIGQLPAGVAALGTLLVPVVGVSAAVLLLGERPAVSDLGGFALIFCAALCVLLPASGKARDQPPRKPA